MARQANLKTVISADASPMRAELAKAKADVKNFGKVSEGALDAFGAALGVNVGKIKEVSSAIQGMGQKMTASSNEAVKGLGSMLKGVSALSAGIAGVGVGVLIAGFKSLQAEAENFSSTIDGLNMKMAQEAWISTYRQAMHDALRDVGSETAQNINNVEKKWTSLTGQLKNGFTGWFADLFSGTDDWKEAFLSAGGAASSFAKNLAVANIHSQKSVILAGKAAEIGEENADIEKQEIQSLVRMSDLSAQIAQYKRDITDTTLSIKERTDAIALAEEAIKEKYPEQIALLKQRLENMKAEHALSGNTVDDVKAEAQLEIQINDLVRQQNEELKSLNRYAKTLTTETSKQSEEYRKQLEAIRAIKQSREDLKAWSVDTSAGKIDISYSLPSDGSLRDDVNAATAAAEDAAKVKVKFQMPKAEMMTPVELPVKPEVDDNFQYLLDSNLGFATIRVGMELDQEKLKDVSAQIESVVGNLAMGLSESIGQLVGDLVTGGDAWGNFATSAMTAFADMAQSVGKMAIEMGLATIGIKAALESLNPYLAIAAGTALVALGAAVKAGLRNVAAGNYSASASVATGSYAASPSSSAAGYSEREINIKVTGTLKASGSELVTVLNNENRRRTATT